MVRIAAVNTRYVWQGERMHEENMAYAYRCLDEAAKGGADFICFPELYPGPMQMNDPYDPYPALAEKTRQIGKYVVYGTSSEAPEAPGHYHVSEVLLGPDGKKIGTYNRTTPPGPWLYKDGSVWDLNYIACNEIPVFQTEFGVVGLGLCSEVHVPEVSRILAIKGAEIAFLPVGLYKGRMLETWGILLRARAIENIMYTVSCHNLIDDQVDGHAMICGPEGDMAVSYAEGILYSDINLEQIRLMRKSPDKWGHPFKSKPGLLDYWRRPEAYREILTPPPPGLKM